MLLVEQGDKIGVGGQIDGEGPRTISVIRQEFISRLDITSGQVDTPPSGSYTDLWILALEEDIELR